MQMLNESQYSNDDIKSKTKELESLLRLHNSIRSIIDMIKSDEVLSIYYQKSFDDNVVQHSIHSKSQNFEPEVYRLRQTIINLKEKIIESNTQKYTDVNKHLFHVEGVDKSGELFISQCISKDICDAINKYRSMGYNVHKINRVTQVSNEEPEIIMDTHTGNNAVFEYNSWVESNPDYNYDLDEFNQHVLQKCRNDIWYFIQTCSLDFDVMENDGVSTFLKAFTENKSAMLCNPRRMGNTTVLIYLYLYIKYIKGCKSIIFKGLNDGFEDCKDRLEKLESSLPDFIRYNKPSPSNIDYVLIDNFEYSDYEITCGDINELDELQTKRFYLSGVINDNISPRKLAFIKHRMTEVNTTQIDGIDFPYIRIPASKLFPLKKLKRMENTMDSKTYRVCIERRR